MLTFEGRRVGKQERTWGAMELCGPGYKCGENILRVLHVSMPVSRLWRERDFGFMAMRGQDAFTCRIGMFPSHIHVRYLTQRPRYTFFPGMSVPSCSSLIRCKTLSPLLPPATKYLDNLPMFHWEICLALGFTSNRESQLKSQIIFEDQRWTQQSRLWLNEMAKSPLRRLSVSGGNWGMGGGHTLGRLYNTNREKWLPCV